MHNPESIQENKTHKILRDFEIQTDRLISIERRDQVIVNDNNNNKIAQSAGAVEYTDCTSAEG